jgi:hypothetical protein
MEIILQDYNSFDQNKNGVKVFEELSNILIKMKESPVSNSTGFRNEFKDAISIKGYPHNVKVSSMHLITLTSTKDDVAIQLQLGYIARAFYDLMKLKYYSDQHNSNSGILICPIKPNGNRAYFERVTQETDKLYSSFIDMPLRIIGIDQ